MKDELEKFIQDNREAFDHKVPPLGLWDKIERQLEEQEDAEARPVRKLQANKKRDDGVWWKVAAIGLFLFSAYLLSERQFDTIRQVKLADQTVPEVYEFQQAEAYYTSLIDEKRAQIAVFVSEDPLLVQDFEQSMQELDRMYLKLKNEWQAEKTDKVVDAMIQNLKLRIDILNRQLQILQKIEQVKQEKNEAVLI